MPYSSNTLNQLCLCCQCCRRHCVQKQSTAKAFQGLVWCKQQTSAQMGLCSRQYAHVSLLFASVDPLSLCHLLFASLTKDVVAFVAVRLLPLQFLKTTEELLQP